MHGASFVECCMQADGYIAVSGCAIGPCNYCFLIEAIPVSDVDRCPAKSIKANPPWKHEGVDQAAVFPGEVQIVEGADKVIPSRVRGEVFDDALVDLGKPLYLFQDFAFGVHEIGFRLPNGEIGTLGFREAVTLGQSTSQQVKAATDAVDDGSGFCIDDRIERLDFREAVQLFAGLRIGISFHGVGRAPTPLNDAFLKHWELGYGPIDSSFSV